MTNCTYKFRIYPNEDQKARLSHHFGVCRYVYNHFLGKRHQSYRDTGKNSSYYKDCTELTQLKKQHEWMADVNSQSLQQELKNLDTAFHRFFTKKSRFPKFHCKHSDKQSFRVPQKVVIANSRIYLPKFRDGIALIQHRKIEGGIKHATILKNRKGQYFAFIAVEREVAQLPENHKIVGIDLGVKNLATCSDGVVFANLSPFKKLERRVRKLQKSLSRKTKGSHNHARAKQLVAACYQKISDIRSNHLHQISRRIVNENQVIVLEDLNVQGMIARRSLAKSLSDTSLGEFVRQITYKSQWYGREVVRIGRWYPSSKVCHSCGYMNDSLTLAHRTWTCVGCNTTHDRDLNASLNILAEGMRQRKTTVGTTGIACGESVSLS